MSINSNEKKHFLFLKEAIATGCVWGLASEQSWAQADSDKYAHTRVMPFWSQPEYATLHISDEWSNYTVVPIALTEFLDDWLLGMHSDNVLIGLNWGEDLEGEELEPLDLLEEFEAITSN